MTTVPFIRTVWRTSRIASTAAPSAFSFSPRPTQPDAASAAASVTRTSSRARLRSGASALTRAESYWVCERTRLGDDIQEEPMDFTLELVLIPVADADR